MKNLILSSLNEFDVDDENNIPLGPWCFRESKEREYLWEDKNFEKIFCNSQELKSDGDYIIGFSNKLAKDYSKKLNQIHGRNYSDKYWSILITPWIIRSLEIFFIRYKTLTKFDGSNLSVSIYKKEKIRSKDSRDFFNFLLSEHGQLFSYSLLINFLKPKKFKIKYSDKISGKSIKETNPKNKNHRVSDLRREIKQIINIIIANFSGIFIDGIKGLTILDSIQIGIRSKIQKKGDIKPEMFAEESNNAMTFLSKYHEFEEFIESILFDLIPDSFTSKFNDHESLAKFKLGLLSKKHNIFLIGAILGGIESQRFFVAQFKEERSGKVIISQHGGLSYGIAKAFPAMAAIEYQHADYFLSWGWKTHSNYKVNAVPMPSPLLSKNINKRRSKEDEIILVGTQVRLTNDKLASRIQSEEAQKYRIDKINFINALNDKKDLVYRSYFSEVDSYPEREFLKSKYRKIKFIDEKFDKRLMNAKCVIIDHPGTTFDISISAQIPTLLFWEKSHWPLTDEGFEVFKNLEKAKIYHQSGSDAAKFLNSISGNIDDWWNSSETKRSINLYQSHYAMISESWKAEWSNLISKLK